MAGMIIIAVLMIVAPSANFIAPHPPNVQYHDAVRHPPSLAPPYPLGADQYGRDVFSRIVYGSRYALFLGIVIVVIQMLMSVALGMIVGYYKDSYNEGQ